MSLRQYWSKLFWIVSGERPTEYESIKRMEVFEFFRILAIHEEGQRKKLDELNTNNNGKSNTRVRR